MKPAISCTEAPEDQSCDLIGALSLAPQMSHCSVLPRTYSAVAGTTGKSCILCEAMARLVQRTYNCLLTATCVLQGLRQSCRM